ncbi:MBL fold metallo-hydrolase RNA specificity domain-containing protein [Rubrivirga sp. IMCC45206]|uniref:MBL fold metallo-hydrolase RNA specificity domain-containing protein n=1 Tax=Rubrivirga sp. IMCC45206 TaxID=3391614 RepID=UPI00398FACBE
MTLTFWGAAQTVTGSLHFVELDDGTRLFLDCGLFQGRRELGKKLNNEWPCSPDTVDAVLLSHAHIDHAGLLPKLWRDGFRGTVYATHATRDLCAIMLRDSAYIQEKDADFFNRKIRKKGQPEVEPLYAMEDAEGVMDCFHGVPYGTPFGVPGGVKVVYRDAGHILGSATMTLDLPGGKRLGFTGDVGNPGRPILRDPQPLPPVDWLICESTYGGREHEPVDQAKERLARIVTETAARGGRVVIPAFAVGRTQEIVHNLDQLWNEDRIPRIPVFVDSPLAVNATAVFQTHPECYDADLLEYMLTDPNPFGFERLEYVREAKRSKELNGLTVPFVVISASGMAEAGRILHHLRNTVEDPKHTVLIVGYQAEHTLGKRIVERRDEVKIFGKPHSLRAQVEVMNTFSAHADEPGLVAFVSALDADRLQTVFLVHGDPERQTALAEAFGRAGIGAAVEAPERGRTVAL